MSHHTKSTDELRNISELLTFNKIAEKMVSELLIFDMSNFLDPSQYANQKGISLKDYLIQMINKILSDTDNNSRGEVNAVYDWKEAFLKCGVRSSLIPLLINYLQDRTIQVKWHRQISSVRRLNGGGPAGCRGHCQLWILIQ